MDKEGIHTKCLDRLVDNDSRVLIVGTLPGRESINAGRYYADKKNQFWNILYGAFNVPYDCGITDKEKCDFLRLHRIALWDVLEKGERKGSSDKDIYSRFYPKEKYHVHFSAKYSGCLGLANMLRVLNKKYSDKLIAIKDADFDHLYGVNYPDIPNMFLTDTHDIETMMLTDGFIRQMERDYSVEDGWGKVNTAINDIHHLSYIKWMNDKTGAKLNFKDTCKVGSCYDGMSCTDISQWLSKIYARSANTGKINFSEKDVNEFERNNPIAKDEIRKLVCGHDMVDAIVHKIHACC